MDSLIAQCVLELVQPVQPVSDSGNVHVMASKTERHPPGPRAAIEKDLLIQIGYFAAHATHIPLTKLCKLARKVIMKVAEITLEDPSSMDVVKAVVGRCRHSQAELLEQVLQTREKLSARQGNQQQKLAESAATGSSPATCDASDHIVKKGSVASGFYKPVCIG